MIEEPEIPFINAHAHHSFPEGVIGIRNYAQNESFQAMDKDLASYGLHPWFIRESKIEENIQKLKQLLDQDRLVAIGECGLDKICKTNLIVQQVVFGHQIRLAVEYSKPMLIHSVRTNNMIIQAYDKYRPAKPWILHGFNGNRQQIEELSERNFYFSLGGMLLKDKTKIRETICFIPSDRLLFETDNSNLPVTEIYKTASDLLNIPINELKKQIFNNFATCFSIDNLK